jgi:L-fuculose-phosphate aldolase
MPRAILDGYIGVKFKAQCSSETRPIECRRYIPAFKENGQRLLDSHMAPANGGNMSTRWERGFFITASGCNLGYIDDDEIIYVEDFSLEDRVVKYRGSRLPSSETFLHGLLYRENRDIASVVHAHDQATALMNLSEILDETEREEPYGTVELAGLCLKTFGKGSDIIVLKNHGYVAVGSSLEQAADIIICMHNRLLRLKGK